MSQADVDLKGNTNFVVLKDLNSSTVVPRTNLAAVDLTVANGIQVAGNTIYAEIATPEDIDVGTTGQLVNAAVLNTVLADKLDAEYATVQASMDGTPEMTASTNSIKSALSVGRAVDVTSEPSASLGTLTYEDGLRGTITWTTTSAGATNIGFYNSGSAFPKFANDLVYILIADVTNTSGAAVTLTFGGTDLNGSAGELASGATRRIAIQFSSATTGYFSFTAAATSSLEINNLREFEVTGCTTNARKYIAALADPDDFNKFYLVDYDEQNPWTYIIDMGDSPAVTVAAGLSYKLNATSGTHTLTVDTCPEGYDGRDSIIRIRLGGNGVVQAVAPLQLGGALVPYAINNCVVRFRDGEAVLIVEDTLAGYVVTVTSGTENGSLAYGLAATGIPYIAFSTGTDGSVVSMGNAVTANEEVTVVGNGYTNTTVTGNITCTNKTTVANLSLQDVTVTGGTMTLGDVYIPNGSTVSANGGKLAIEKVTGDGGVVALENSAKIPAGGSSYLKSVTLMIPGSLEVKNASVLFSSTVISGASTGMPIESGGTAVFKDCTVDAKVYTDSYYGFGGRAEIIGSNVVLKSITLNLPPGSTGSGTVVVSSGAIIDFTGSTATIGAVNGVTFDVSGATVYPSAGSASAYMLGGMTVPRIGNTNVVNFGGSRINLPKDNITYASGCVFISGGNDATSGGPAFLQSAGTFTAINCTFSSCGKSGANGGAIQGQSNVIINLTGCTFKDNIGNTKDIFVNNGASIVASDCSFGGHVTLFGSTTQLTIAGTENSFYSVGGSGSVIISSGASIALTNSIAPNGGIQVEGGTCTVNGNVIESGPYSSIDSTGTPT